MARAREGTAAKRLDEAFPNGAPASAGRVGARERREHRRVTEWLRELADDWEYSKPVGLPDREVPCALFRTEAPPFDVFFGDAKEDHRPSQKASADEVRRHFETLLGLLERGDLATFLFGAGTGDDDVAGAWSDFLVELADENDIEVEPRRHAVGDDDRALIFVYVQIPPPAEDDDDEDDESDDAERAE